MPSMEVQVTPEIAIGAGASPAPQVSLDWTNMKKDMDNIAAELNQGDMGPLVVEAVAPEIPVQAGLTDATAQPLPAAAPVTTPVPVVPNSLKKFANADGKIDNEKVYKSFLEAEKQLGRLQNQLHQQTAAGPVPIEPQPQAPFVSVNPFAQQVATDLQAQGFDPTTAQRLSPVLVKLAEAQYQAAVAQGQAQYEQVRIFQQDQSRKDELKAIAERDPQMFSDEGIKILMAYRQSRPWINQSPEPWKEAYRQYVADRALEAQTPGQQVYTPIPNKAPTAPPAPVGAAGRAAIGVPQFNTVAELNAHLDKLTHAQQDEFWRHQGINMRDSQLFSKQV